MQRFSSRLEWGAPPNALSSAVAERRRAGHPLIDLTTSNPTVVFDDYPHHQIAAALGSISNLTYRPEAFGDFETRMMLGSRLSLAPQRLALTSSTSEAYSLLFKLLADPGDEILVPSPSYPLFDYLASLEGLTPRTYRLAYDGSWHLDFTSLVSALSDRTRAIVLVNPNNPTGSYLKNAEWDRLAALADAHQLPLISDEVFGEYPFDLPREAFKTLAQQSQVLSFSLDGLSKIAAMPQMKLGWIAVGGPEEAVAQALDRLELVLDTYLPASAAVQRSLAKLLPIGDRLRTRLRTRIHNNLETLDQKLVQSSAHRLHAEGGWSAILRLPNYRTEEEWALRLLREQSVIVQPGYFFDMPGEAYLIVSLIVPEPLFAEGIERLAGAV